MKNRFWRKIAIHFWGPEQRWPVLVALAAIGGLYTAMPRNLLPFPNEGLRFAPIVIILVLATPLIWSHRDRHIRLNEILAHVLLGILTVFMLASVYLLVRALPEGRESGGQLLRSAASLWMTNILVFACWYWRLDSGGPHIRAAHRRHESGAFLFPQMTLNDEALEQSGQTDWKPGFIDYLFLAFNTSTALSPADTPVLSRWAKLMMMTQSVISFTVIILLAARAINILPGH